MIPNFGNDGKGFWSFMEVIIAKNEVQLFKGSTDDFLKKAKETGDTKQYQKLKTISFPENKLETVKKEYNGIGSMKDFMRLYAASLPEIRELEENPRAVVSYQIREKSRFLGLKKDKIYDITILSPKQA